MSKYRVTIDCTMMRPKLHELERGNAIRMVHTNGLRDAVAIANLAAFAAGKGMRRGPRSLRIHEQFTFRWAVDGDMEIRITRLK